MALSSVLLLLKEPPLPYHVTYSFKLVHAQFLAAPEGPDFNGLREEHGVPPIVGTLRDRDNRPNINVAIVPVFLAEIQVSEKGKILTVLYSFLEISLQFQK